MLSPDSPGMVEARHRIERAPRERTRELNLCDLQLSTLPESLGQLTELRRLDLHNNQLTTLPEWLGRLTTLQQLDLNDNQFTMLPEWLGQLTALRMLRLDSNQLTTLPESLGELPALRVLRLGNNRLTTLPESLGRLTALQVLYLFHNQLTALPEWLGQLTALRLIGLSNNRFTMLPESLGRLTALESLDLNDNRLTTLPDSLGQLTTLRRLYLNNNHLSSLPESLGQLTALERLDLNNNPPLKLPESLGQLTALRRLDLDHNQLTTPPAWLGRLTALQRLALNHNQLAVLPEWLGQLTTLRLLDLNYNQLATLPDSVGQLTALERLDLRNNQLTTLPDSVGQLTALEKLDLCNNQLITLPDSVGQLTALRRLFLHKNPRLGLPDEALGPTWEAIVGERATPKLPKEILGYYFRIHPPKKRGAKVPPWTGPNAKPVLEARIIVIGDGAAGKTSLVRQLLRGQTARIEEPSTKDVIIERWPMKLQGKPVQVNLWDFGGQRQMHAAHPYFFTTRTLYLVVAEARKDQQDRLDYWLRMVAKYGRDARALVVVNKAEGHGLALDRPKLLDRYRENLPPDASHAFYATSCTEGTGIEELKAAIIRELASTDQVFAQWPGEWFRVKEALSKLRNPERATPRWLIKLLRGWPWSRSNAPEGTDTLSMEAWRTTCEDCGVKDGIDQDELLENLGHLGQVMSFPRDAQLCQLGVLNPEWVTRAIYPLLQDTSLAAKGGLLMPNDLGKLLPADRYPKERHVWLLRLMKSFELIFEDQDGRWLLPGHLPSDSPPWAQPDQWAGENTLQLELRYDVLPESVISQFIVRRHQDARVAGEWWRHGIALKRGQCQALVRAHMTEAEAKIELRVQGPITERREFLSMIRETLRDPKDATPPELFVILGKDCAEPYHKLLTHAAAGKRELDFILDGKSVTLPLAPIVDMIETPAEQAASRERVNFQLNITNAQQMNKDNHSIQTGNVTGGAVGQNNSVTNNDSFNTNSDVRALLQVLRGEFDKLPASPADTVRSFVEAIEVEAKKETPNKGFLVVTRNGLVDAAETCADMVRPLVAAAGAVVDYFSK